MVAGPSPMAYACGAAVVSGVTVAGLAFGWFHLCAPMGLERIGAAIVLGFISTFGAGLAAVVGFVVGLRVGRSKRDAWMLAQAPSDRSS